MSNRTARPQRSTTADDRAFSFFVAVFIASHGITLIAHPFTFLSGIPVLIMDAITVVCVWWMCLWVLRKGRWIR